MLVLAPDRVSSTHIASTVAVIALSALALALVGPLHRKLRIAKGFAPIPGPKGWPLLGILPEFIANLPRVYEYQEDLLVQHGGRVRVQWNIFSDGMLYISSPEDVQHILATNFDNYVRSKHFQRSFGDMFAKSFLAINHAHTADNGELWRVQRKLAAKVFTTNNFKRFAESIFSKYADTMAGVIEAHGGACNMHDISSQYTLQAIFDIACGAPLRDIDDSLGMRFVASLSFIAKQGIHRLIMAPYFKYLWWCMPSEYAMRRHERAMFAVADRLLHARLQESDDAIEQRSDIMSLFIKKARELDDASEGVAILDTETLRSVFLTFVFAGWETTSSAITWTFYALAQYPDVQQRVVDELLALDKPTLSYDDVKTLKYLDTVVNETLRLYPSAVFGHKVAAEDDHLPDGTFVPAGTDVLYSVWYMGRHNAKLWGDDQLVFRPERWFEMTKRPTAYEFPVFQGGPRMCPGMNMSLLETKIFVATLLRKFHVKIQDGEQVVGRTYTFSTTLTMDGGLPLQFTPREVAAEAVAPGT